MIRLIRGRRRNDRAVGWLWSFFLPWMLTSAAALAQDVTLRGFVTDRSTGSPLAGANVTLRDEDTVRFGAVTDADGYYRIVRIPAGRFVLGVSYVGYVTHRDTLRLGHAALETRSVALEPGEVMDELVIEGRGGAATLESGRQQVRAVDLARVPTPDASGDLAAYLQTLPGIVSPGDRGGQLFVRGGTPGQNLVLVDGTMIYQPFHIVGFFSAFPQDLVSSADVFAGGFGARYTGRLSSVIDVTMRGGNTRRFEAAASVGPFLAGVRLEGPLRRGTTSLLGSVRTSVIEHTAPTLLGESVPLSFSDVVLKLQHTGGGGNRCSLSAVRTHDRGRVSSDAERTEVFRWGNTVFAGRCVGLMPGSSAFIEANSGFSYVSNSVGDIELPERSSDAWLFNTDVHWRYPVGRTDVEGGFFLQVEGGSYRLAEQFQGIRDEDDYHVGTGVHVGATLRAGERFDVEPGLAVTYPLNYAPALEPRLRLAWRPWGTAAQTLTAALGVYRQTVEGLSDERDVGSVFTVWMPTPVGEARPRALHALLGWQQHVGSLTLAAEGYYKRLHSLPVPVWSVIAQFTTSLTLADGEVYGSDFRLEWRRKPAYAYLGYGYSWTKYMTAQDNFGLWFDEPIQSYHPPHDRRHQFNAILALDTGLFTAGARWQYGSGLPYTRAIGADSFIRFINLPDVRSLYGRPRFLFDKPYQGRLPAYHRLDVSVEHAFDLHFADITVQAGATNVYDRRNLFYFDLFTFRRVDQWSFLPYVSLLVEVR